MVLGPGKKHKLTTMPSPFLLAATVVIALFTAMGESLALSHFEYSTVTGYFLQDDPATDPADFDYVCFPSATLEIDFKREKSTQLIKRRQQVHSAS